MSKELQAIIAGELPTIQDGFADALSAMHRQMLDAEHELGVNDHRGEFKLQNRMGLNAPGQTTGRPKRSGGRRPTAKHLADKANARKKGGKKG